MTVFVGLLSDLMGSEVSRFLYCPALQFKTGHELLTGGSGNLVDLTKMEDVLMLNDPCTQKITFLSLRQSAFPM